MLKIGQEDNLLKLVSLALLGPTKTGASNLQPNIMAEIDCVPY